MPSNTWLLSPVSLNDNEHIIALQQHSPWEADTCYNILDSGQVLLNADSFAVLTSQHHNITTPVPNIYQWILFYALILQQPF